MVSCVSFKIIDGTLYKLNRYLFQDVLNNEQ